MNTEKYRVLELGDPNRVVGEYEDIRDAAMVMDELIRDGLDVRIEMQKLYFK